MSLKLWIAEELLLFVGQAGDRTEGRIAIAQPVVVPGGPAECWIALDGLRIVNGPIYGESTLQALLLAISLVASEVDEFLARGGRDLSRDEDPCDVARLLSEINWIQRVAQGQRPGP